MKANQRAPLRIEEIFPFSFPSFTSLPVCTLAAWIRISRIADVSSGDLNLTLALHFPKVPVISIKAFTLNLIELSARFDREYRHLRPTLTGEITVSAITKTLGSRVLMPLSLRPSLASVNGRGPVFLRVHSDDSISK
jgi:hypothetical protein